MKNMNKTLTKVSVMLYAEMNRMRRVFTKSFMCGRI